MTEAELPVVVLAQAAARTVLLDSGAPVGVGMKQVLARMTPEVAVDSLAPMVGHKALPEADGTVLAECSTAHRTVADLGLSAK